LPGQCLYLLSTGTGLAPFLSIIRDPETYEKYESVVLVHGCRRVSELAYADRITREWLEDGFIGEQMRQQLTYYPTVTREPFRNRGRIDHLIISGQLFADIGRSPLDAGKDRIMLCGSPDMLASLRQVLCDRGFEVGSNHTPGTFVVEKAFVDR
jgi:ferredoxin--NADP+ reductase